MIGIQSELLGELDVLSNHMVTSDSLQKCFVKYNIVSVRLKVN